MGAAASVSSSSASSLAMHALSEQDVAGTRFVLAGEAVPPLLEQIATYLSAKKKDVLEEEVRKKRLLGYARGEEEEGVVVLEGGGGEEEEELSAGSSTNTNVYVLNVECLGLTTLAHVHTHTHKAYAALPLHGLNASSNALDDGVEDALLIPPSPLALLQIGGNSGISSLLSVTKQLPESLVILDLSFTDSLLVPFGCFLHCPQLLRLVLDGCGLSSTTCVTTKGASASIFFGLLILQDLSIKENRLEDETSFEGLSFFATTIEKTAVASITEAAEAAEVAEAAAAITTSPSLVSLWIADNPYTEAESQGKSLLLLLRNNIATLQQVDGKQVVAADVTSSSSSSSMSTFLRREGGGGSAGIHLLKDDKGIDAMEREYLSALKGEKDVAVVA